MIIFGILTTILLILFVYIGLPTLSVYSPGLLMILVLILFTVWAVLEELKIKENIRKITIGLIFFVLTFLILVFIGSWSLFRADDYSSLIGEKGNGVIHTGSIEELSNFSNIRKVDKEIAQKMADKKIGEIPSLGSRVRLGEMDIQKIGKTLYWVAPLEHSGLFKWLKFKSTLGYIKVNAETGESKLVKKELNYLKSSFFSKDINRKIYFKNPFNFKEEYSFEIDDNGNPYWVASTYNKTIGFGGDVVDGVIILNAKSGEIKEYSIDHIPDWVDRIQPERITYRNINYHGKYLNGFWNLSQDGMYKISSNFNMGSGNGLYLTYLDETPYWFIPLTSVGGDDSIIGFHLVNTRNGKIKRYNLSGATPQAAKKSAEGSVQEKGYTASDAVMPYKINGEMVYKRVAPRKLTALAGDERSNRFFLFPCHNFQS